MSYDTTFNGRFDVDPPLTKEHQRILQELASEEHVPGEDGKPDREGSSGYPCRYCQWVPSADGKAIQWDLGEKFYCWLEWLRYIVNHHLIPWGYRLNGQVRWRGSNSDDNGIIYAKDNLIEAVQDVNPGPSWNKG